MVQILNGRSKSADARRKPRAEGRALARRLGILRAAARVFRAHGFANTGMRQIAEAAELSSGNLYYYFASKQELLYFCQDYSLDRMLDAIKASREEYASTAAERLHLVIDQQLRLMLDELAGAAAHLEVDALPAAMRARIVKKRDRYERAVREIIADGMAHGTFVPGDPALTTRAILGALNWTARWYRPDGPRSPAEIAKAFSDYLVRGLRR
jgi:AcrR family transcriptional regulator